jgi:uncharacterized protein (TIGR02145 family)
MKCKSKIWAYPLILTGILLFITNGCKKDESNNTTILPSVKTIVFNPDSTYGTVTDIDGNNYNTIKIGTQIWMAENLKVTKFRNGNPIPNITEASVWVNTLTPAYCDYNNTPTYSVIYGKLYNLFTIIDQRNLCPSGWHIPADSEWTVLINNSGGQSIAGIRLKEKGLDHWQSPLDTAVKNFSGFTALPGGFRNGFDGTFNMPGFYGYWWSTTKNSTYDFIYRSMGYSVREVHKAGAYPVNGFSVRCVKDSI